MVHTETAKFHFFWAIFQTIDSFCWFWFVGLGFFLNSSIYNRYLYMHEHNKCLSTPGLNYQVNGKVATSSQTEYGRQIFNDQWSWEEWLTIVGSDNFQRLDILLRWPQMRFLTFVSLFVPFTASAKASDISFAKPGSMCQESVKYHQTPQQLQIQNPLF